MNTADMHLKTEVEAELEWDPKFNATKIGVVAKNGAVILTGEVDSYADKWAAEDAAKRVAGVRSVADELTVKVLGHHKHNDEEIAQAVLRALEWNVWVPKEVRATVREGRISLEGTVEFNYQHDAAEDTVRHLAGVTSVLNQIVVTPRASATEVQEQVESALRRQATSDANSIQVGTSGGTVTLTGNASSWRAIENATNAAWAAPGVSRVQNHVLMTGF